MRPYDVPHVDYSAAILDLVRVVVAYDLLLDEGLRASFMALTFSGIRGLNSRGLWVRKLISDGVYGESGDA